MPQTPAVSINTYTVTLLKRREIAENTFEIELEKPKNFTYAPGQYILILFENRPDIKPYSFSLASSPIESHLMTAMRRSSSPFKQTLSSLPLGSKIIIKGPFGRLTLPQNTSIPIILMAGGIGITPFRGFLMEEIKNNFNRTMTLFYANRNLSSAAYLDELSKIQNPHFEIIHVLEKPPKHGDYERGFITSEILKKYIKDIHLPMYYVVGPPRMVRAMEKILADMNIDPQKIKKELFTGYR